MNSGKVALVLSPLAVLLSLASCSDGGSDGAALLSAVQDLDEDPNGLTTVLRFNRSAPLFAPASIESDGGEQAVAAEVSSDDESELIVTWDGLVAPGDNVRVLGSDEIPETFVAVSTSDASATTFSVSDAIQTPGLGGDTISVQFSGPRVDPDAVVDGANWSLVEGGLAIPLDQADLNFNVAAQTLTIVTDVDANVHTSFDLVAENLASVSATPIASTPVAGSADDDSTAPTLVSVTQNLSVDEFGRVVDFVFSEAMDPNFATQLSNYSLGFPVFATAAVQVDATTIRATFPQPVVPSVDSVELTAVLDAHGNAYVGADPAVSQGTTVANAYATPDTPEVRTVSGSGNDVLVVETLQALDPRTAEVAVNWGLAIDSVPVDLSAETLSYDLLARELTVSLPADYLNGLAFTLTPAAVLDVDGEAFVAVGAGTISGDTQEPGIEFIVQNREIDTTGKTLDVHFSEDIAETSAEVDATWDVATVPAEGQFANIDSIEVVEGDASVVRLTLDVVALPTLGTVDASGVTDLAGTAMSPAVSLQFSSTDEIAPDIVTALASGIEGAGNDTLVVAFTEPMYGPDVETNYKWSVESPVGTPLAVDGATIVYDEIAKTGTLVLPAGLAFQIGDDVQLQMSGVRDAGGNALSDVVRAIDVDVETRLPRVESIFAQPDDTIVVRFDETIANVSDGFTLYELLNDSGTVVGISPAVTVDGDGRGLTLDFGQVVVAGTNRLSISGVTDEAGNMMVPVIDAAIDTQIATTLALDTGLSEVQIDSGESNDRLVFEFNQPLSRFNVLESSNYQLFEADGITAVDTGTLQIDFDGVSIVTLQLGSGAAPALQNGVNYVLSVDGLTSAQGELMPAASTDLITGAGDATAPDALAIRPRASSVDANTALVELDEALDPIEAANLARYAIAGLVLSDVTQIGPRSVQLEFDAPVVGQTLSISARDLAGNELGTSSVAVQIADTVAPSVGVTTSAEAVEGIGGDIVKISFSEPLDAPASLQADNFTLDIGGVNVDMAATTFSYSSVDNTATLRLPADVDIDTQATVTATVTGVVDHDGNAMSATANLNVPIVGDFDAPSIEAAFVNRRFDATGQTLDVVFSEDLDAVLAIDAAAWSVSDGTTAVTDAALMSGDVVRLTLDAPMPAGETIDASGLRDAAGNDAGPLSIQPLL